MYLPPHTITLEEHTLFPSLTPTPFYTSIFRTFPWVHAALTSHSGPRLADLDAGHVSTQILSHLPGLATANPPSASQSANDEMAAAISAHPARLAGFAALPMQDPSAAAAELERAVTQLGLVGAMVDNCLPDGTHYDGERFWGVWEAAERLDVPVYLHPAPPATDEEGDVLDAKFRGGGGYGEVVAMGLATGAWGWHADVALHVLKLYAAGVFARFPGLKVVIGHMGEMLPMQVDRVEELKFFKSAGLPSFRSVWERNVWVTSSGVFSVRTLEMLRKVVGMEKILYAVDTPFNSSERGWRFVVEAAESGVLTKEEVDAFAFGNARRLLKLELEKETCESR